MEAPGIYKILVDVRKILEATKSKKEFLTVSFYCSWLLHQELNYKGHWYILEKASEACDKCWNNGKEDFELAISDCFNIDIFRNELIQLFDRHQIDTSIFAIEGNWSQFFSGLLSELIDQPISVGDKIFEDDGITSYAKAKELFNNRFRVIVVSLELVEKKRDDSNLKDVFWKARVEMPGWTTDKEHCVYLMGQLVSECGIFPLPAGRTARPSH